MIFKEHRFDRNPQEKIFVEQFINDCGYKNDMDLIVFGSEDGFNPKDNLTDREKSIVIGTIQWLGSSVGQNFLRQCGFEKTNFNKEQCQ